MYALKLKIDGQIELIEMPKDPHYTWYPSQIGCEWMEIVRPINSPYTLVIDEEGLLKEEHFINPHASVMYGFLKHRQPIVGEALLLIEKPSPEGPELTGFTKEEALCIKDGLDTQTEAVFRQIAATISDEGD